MSQKEISLLMTGLGSQNSYIACIDFILMVFSLFPSIKSPLCINLAGRRSLKGVFYDGR